MHENVSLNFFSILIFFPYADYSETFINHIVYNIILRLLNIIEDIFGNTVRIVCRKCL